MRVLFTIFILSIFFCACDKPESNPELKDPVYLDLQKKLTVYEKELKYTREERGRLIKFVKEGHPHDVNLGVRRKTFHLNEDARIKAEQQVNYIKIALEKRKKNVRLRYLEAYKRGEEDSWQSEFEHSSFKSRIENNSFLEVAN